MYNSEDNINKGYVKYLSGRDKEVRYEKLFSYLI